MSENQNLINRREAIKRTSLFMGGVLRTSAILGVLQGCSPSREVDWEPVFLNKQQATLAGDMADRIIPPTDTPGALDVGVDRFMDLMLKDCYSDEEQNAFLMGIQDFQKKCNDEMGDDFQDLEPEKKDQMLQGLADTEVPQGKPSFWRIIRELTLLGYFTSEQGIKQNFEYRPVPGLFEGCVDEKPGEKVWRGNHV